MNAAGLRMTGIAASAAACSHDDQFRLVVGLAHLDLEAQFLSGLLTDRHQTLEVGVAVHVGLPGTEAAEIGPVEHPHGGHALTRL